MAHGQANGVLLDAHIGQLGIAQLAVGGRSRVDHQALHIGHIGQQAEQLQMVNKCKGFLAPALDLKSKDRAAAVGEIALVQRMVGVTGQAGVVHLFHQRMGSQILHHLFGVLGVAVAVTSVPYSTAVPPPVSSTLPMVSSAEAAAMA